MPLPKQLSAYVTVLQALDTAIANGGGYIPFPTPGKARNWLQKANMARKLMREERGSTSLDEWTFRVEQNRVIIEPAVMPSVLSLDNNRTLPAAAPRNTAEVIVSDEEDADIFEKARDFARGLEIDEEE